MEKKKPAHQFELSNLTNSSASNIKDRTLSEGFAPMKNVTEKINTREVIPQLKANEFTESIAKKLALKNIGKKIAGIIPLAGTAYAALSGDPAMAAEEAVGDVPFIGQAYEALKSEDAGNRDEEREMLNERNAQVNYANSPSSMDARRRALQNFGQ